MVGMSPPVSPDPNWLQHRPSLPRPHGDSTWPPPRPGRARVTAPSWGGGSTARAWEHTAPGPTQPLCPPLSAPGPGGQNGGRCPLWRPPWGPPPQALWPRAFPRGFPPAPQRGLCGCPRPGTAHNGGFVRGPSAGRRGRPQPCHQQHPQTPTPPPQWASRTFQAQKGAEKPIWQPGGDSNRTGAELGGSPFPKYRPQPCITNTPPSPERVLPASRGRGRRRCGARRWRGAGRRAAPRPARPPASARAAGCR